MPELPEVETIRSQLAPLLRGAVISDAWAFSSAKFDQAPTAIGATIGEVRRRGKYLLIELDHDRLDRASHTAELVVHLGMTGRLSVTSAAETPAAMGAWSRSTLTTSRTTPHLRARWDLADGRSLLFDDVRRFGRIAVVTDHDYSSMPTLAALGPEPFDDAFSPQWLRAEINRSSRAVKTQLLSQRVVAGVGNIYADEALWRAGIHPRARRLTRAGAIELRDAVRDVLETGLANGGTTLRDYRHADGRLGQNQHRLECYGRAGAPCSRCEEPLAHCVLDTRSTTFCPNCQQRSGRRRPTATANTARDGCAQPVVLDCGSVTTE